MATEKKQILFLIFPGFNTLDLNGPQEVFKNYGIGATQDEQAFDISIAAFDDVTTAFERVQVKRDISFDNALKSVSSFDIMVVAGGPGENVDAAIKNTNTTGMLQLISQFASLKADSTHPKWLISICTGAGFLGTCGLFAGKTVTTHFGYRSTLQKICDDLNAKNNTKATKVVKERWVNAGVIDSGIKLVTSGGISCGLDCCLWVVSEIVSLDKARNVAKMMDYDWKFSPNPEITSGWIV